MKTVKFIANGKTVKTVRVRRGESHYEAADRSNINIHCGKESGDCNVWKADYLGQQGEVKFV